MKPLDFRRFYGMNFRPFAQDAGTFHEEDHPRAPAGGSKGGQFSSGGGSGGAGGKAEGKKAAKTEGGGKKSAGGGRKYPLAPKGTWYGEENYESTGGKMVEMSPEEFLKKARPLEVDESSRENIDDLKRHMQDGNSLDPLHFREETGKEDGRHRAIAAKELGIEKVPVIVWPKKDAGGGSEKEQIDKSLSGAGWQTKSDTSRPGQPLSGMMTYEHPDKPVLIQVGSGTEARWVIEDQQGNGIEAGYGRKELETALEKVKPAAGAAPNTAGEKLFTSTYDPKTTVDDVLATKPAHAKEALEAAKRRLEGVVPTDAPVDKGGHKMPNGQYTPEREKVQRAIFEKTFSDEKIKAATPAPGEKPIASFLGGRGGSGKSWFTRPGGPVDAGKAIVLNSDFFKEALPEYQGWNAAQVHEESTDMLNRALDIAKRMGLNIVLDATMRSEGGIGRYVSDFNEAGYELNGYYMHTSPQEAASRAVDRFLRGGTNGRYVPPELILGSTTNEKVFDKVSSFMRKWAIYDNNEPGASAPKFVAEGGK
jgi:hypothetical protein